MHVTTVGLDLATHIFQVHGCQVVLGYQNPTISARTSGVSSLVGQTTTGVPSRGAALIGTSHHS